VKRGLALCAVALVVWAFHAVSVHVLFGRDVIALLLSPGSHSSLLGLLAGVVFVLSRLAAVVLAPALGLAGVALILLSFGRPAPN
jgi:hypothetical protein